MYTFPSQLKITALTLILVGFLGIVYGFLSAFLSNRPVHMSSMNLFYSMAEKNVQ